MRQKEDFVLIRNRSHLLQLVKSSDVVLEVIEARNPLGTRSIKLEKLSKALSKPLILLLNKIDLVPRDVLYEWVEYFEEKGIKVIPTSASRKKGRQDIIKALEDVRIELNKDRIIGIIAGVPKTGKSSIINYLKNKESAPTSPYPGKPGYTKAPSLYKIAESIYVYDTPGIFPDARDPLEREIRSRPIEKIVDPVKPASAILRLAEDIVEGQLERIYGLPWSGDPFNYLSEIAKRRGWLEKISKDPLIDQAALRVIMDYLNGRIKIYRRRLRE